LSCRKLESASAHWQSDRRSIPDVQPDHTGWRTPPLLRTRRCLNKHSSSHFERDMAVGCSVCPGDPAITLSRSSFLYPAQSNNIAK